MVQEDHLALGAEGRDEGGEHDQPGIGHQLRHLAHAGPVLGGELPEDDEKYRGWRVPDVLLRGNQAHIARWRRERPRSLLDNSPLQSLLHRLVPFERLPMLMAQGHLRALAVTASSYSSGQHVTFYEADDERGLSPWTRSQRIAVRTTLNTQHLLASSAIPFVFPAIQLPIGADSEWFGDGSMRQAAPISPAVHLGAERVLIIGAGRMTEPPGQRRGSDDYPSVAQIAGHALSNIFLDALAVDVERLQRINATLKLLPPDALARTTLRPIETLVIAPSQRLDDLAAKARRGALEELDRANGLGDGLDWRAVDLRPAPGGTMPGRQGRPSHWMRVPSATPPPAGVLKPTEETSRS